MSARFSIFHFPFSIGLALMGVLSSSVLVAGEETVVRARQEVGDRHNRPAYKLVISELAAFSDWQESDEDFGRIMTGDGIFVVRDQESGHTFMELPHRKGVAHGVCTLSDPDGTCVMKVTYRDGVMHGAYERTMFCRGVYPVGHAVYEYGCIKEGEVTFEDKDEESRICVVENHRLVQVTTHDGVPYSGRMDLELYGGGLEVEVEEGVPVCYYRGDEPLNGRIEGWGCVPTFEDGKLLGVKVLPPELRATLVDVGSYSFVLPARGVEVTCADQRLGTESVAELMNALPEVWNHDGLSSFDGLASIRFVSEDGFELLHITAGGNWISMSLGPTYLVTSNDEGAVRTAHGIIRQAVGETEWQSYVEHMPWIK